MTEIKPLLLVLVGMPGAGKSSCVNYLKEKNYPSVYFGGITQKEVRKRGLEMTPDNEKLVREDLRRLHGKEAYAELIVEEIEQLQIGDQNHIVVDGLYSWSEYKFFKNTYGDNAVVVAVTSPRKLRHSRLKTRLVRPLSEEEATKRDYAEIENIEKGGPIANADYTIINNTSLENLTSQLEKVLHTVRFGPHYR